ncbi:MAG: hypothetical protein K2X03_15410 [Bryobacteraceae bacterium]|nr:hypothetical protein [Bryobacteraceae bacterium]
MKFLPLATFALVATMAPSLSAAVQCIFTPTPTLIGTWTFSTQGYRNLRGLPTTQFLGAVGQFTASVNAATNRGVLDLTSVSSALNGSPVRSERDAGSFQVSEDCLTGTLTMNLSSRPVQFDYYFLNANEILLVSTTPGDNLQGRARRFTGSTTCPVPALSALSGAWAFQTQGTSGVPFNVAAVNFNLLNSTGRFVAGINAAGIGVLDLTVTSSFNGSITRAEFDRGRYQINPDCLGGTLTFNLSSRPVQFDFVFVSPTEIELVGTNNGEVIVGNARLFAGFR